MMMITMTTRVIIIINNSNKYENYVRPDITAMVDWMGVKHQVTCNGAEWSKNKTQAAESIKWRPQQAYGSNQFLLVQPQTVFSTHTKSSRSRIDKRTARATGNTRYRYSKKRPSGPQNG